MILTPWTVEHPTVLALQHRQRAIYLTLGALADSEGAPDGSVSDAAVRRVSRVQTRIVLEAAGLLQQLPSGRWQVLAPRVAQEVGA